MNFFKKRSLKKRINTTFGNDRAEALYEYIRLHINEAAKKRPITLGEYELVSAMILGNVVAITPNRKSASAAFSRVERMARALVNDGGTKNGGVRK